MLPVEARQLRRLIAKVYIGAAGEALQTANRNADRRSSVGCMWRDRPAWSAIPQNADQDRARPALTALARRKFQTASAVSTKFTQ